MNLTTIIITLVDYRCVCTMFHTKMICNIVTPIDVLPLFLAGMGVTMRANCYPNGTVSYSWNSSLLTWHLQIEYQCYNNGTTHEQTVSSTALLTCSCLTY